MTERTFVALDLETTGLNPDRDTIIEIGAVRIVDGRMTDEFSTLINPRRSIPLQIQQLTGISNEDVVNAPELDEIVADFVAFVGRDTSALIAHNARFDIGFLTSAGIHLQRPALDTFELATILLPGMPSYSLGELARALGIPLESAHRALDDTRATAQLFLHLQKQIDALPLSLLQSLARLAQESTWGARLLFDDALSAHGVPEAEARTDLRRMRLHPAAPADLGETLVCSGGPPPTAVNPEAIPHFFAPGGPLSTLFGAAYEVRLGQQAMAQRVLEALNQGDHALIEAGTGVGKSLAYLYPAAIWSMQNQRRVVIATNTITLQEQLLEKEIPQLQRLLDAAGNRLEVALLKGRRNYLCTRRLHNWLSRGQLTDQELVVLARILVWLPVTQTGDVSELFLGGQEEHAIWSHLCSDAATCSAEGCNRHGLRDYYLDARRYAESAHILIVNHALLMADLAAENHLLPAFDHLIVDEAHRLEEAATEQLGLHIRWPSVFALLERLTLDGDLLSAVYRQMQQQRSAQAHHLVHTLSTAIPRAQSALTRLAERLDAFAQEHQSASDGNGYAARIALDSRMHAQPAWSEIEIQWEDVATHLDANRKRLDELVGSLVEEKWHLQEPQAALLGELRSATDQLGAVINDLNRVIGGPGILDHDTVTWLETDERTRARRNSYAVEIRGAPRSVGRTLETAIVHRCHSAIFTGATLRTHRGFQYIQERLGLWDVDPITVDSPFDYERNVLLCMPSDLPLPNQRDYQRSVEQAIVDAAQAADGRTLVLFTSHAHLRTTADAIRLPLDSHGITLLQHGAGSRRRLLRAFRNTERAVLLGARTFWEGIDLPGDQVRVLLIARVPFAVPSDPLVAARGAEYDDSFNDYMLPDAVLRFRQGFGRLIRRASDRGVVVLLDSRIWNKRYGQAFLDALPHCSRRRGLTANLGIEIDVWLNTFDAPCPEPNSDG